MILDVHNHYYPPEFIAAIRTGPSKYTVETDEDGNPVLVSPGDKNFVVPGHRDIAFRERVIAEAGVDMQAITLTAPGTTMEEPATSARPGVASSTTRWRRSGRNVRSTSPHWRPCR